MDQNNDSVKDETEGLICDDDDDDELQLQVMDSIGDDEAPDADHKQDQGI